jgi:hypothetical protein
MREDHRLTTDEDAYGRRKIILPLGHPAETQYCETLYIFSSISTKLNLPSLALSMKLSSKYSLAASCKVLFILYN